MENIQKEKIGIENIKLALEAIITIINHIKASRKPLAIALLSIGKIVKINFKLIGSEIKDLGQDEREELVGLIVEKGFTQINALNVIDNLSKGIKIKPLAIAKQLLK